MDYQIINEQSIMIKFEPQIDPETFKKVQQIVKYLEQQAIEAITEVVPSYRAVMIHFDQTKINAQELIDTLNLDNLDLADIEVSESSKIVYIPVVYGGEYGPDLKAVAEHNQLSTDEVIKLHTEPTYLIYMLGFMPGFPYLGGLDERLYTPRRDEPRVRIDAGSVGIANNQTGLYPQDSPGGWQIIGRTPLDVFDLNREPMTLYAAGDNIQFYEISEADFDEIMTAKHEPDFDLEKWVNR
ncbi:allophanate hydrolase subunit 1 [Staphylococcus piscifermentans]|uniref:Allophanate hydrolase n=1 Tax=Staphylococcus piscifermentans TaxID=70258 RepID=A0A239TKV5_9STAP|nr:5-oxoprolinase subunit PxpB [Staphylococcus piscifermentans]RTX86183.1 5-oxoprolinase subunit PxpB [Staphylococcus piscifermentans]GEP84887.1 allophanate hydrolase [Staphylococcus piscifermentans]SNU98437.1 allophanate hydrolase subunit 1 [Staphylococcus piscifermentans]